MITYKNLDTWKKSMELVKNVYQLVKNYPRDEMYGLSSQTKRAVVSIPANIAEGVGRNYKKDTIQFLHISRGSMYELDTLLNVAIMNGFVSEAAFSEISNQIEECLKMLNGLISYYEKSSLK